MTAPLTDAALAEMERRIGTMSYAEAASFCLRDLPALIAELRACRALIQWGANLGDSPMGTVYDLERFRAECRALLPAGRKEEG